MLLSKIEGTTPRLLDLTTLPELNETGETGTFVCYLQSDDYLFMFLLAFIYLP